ncbi:FAD-dependent oxidoreductase [archaeon]|nr:FAD-dependent oxidoreductase [archaeon]
MKYDVIVIGGGPGGLSAAIYTARYNLKTLLIAKEMGGTMMDAHVVENYPSYESIGGMDLMKKFEDHAKKVGVEFKDGEIKKIEKLKEGFKVDDYEARTVILATGTDHRHLNVKGEKEFEAKGVSYCYTCDAPLFKNKDKVIVVGGGDAAAQGSLLLSEYAKNVVMMYRSKIRAEPMNMDKVKAKKNIELMQNEISEIYGDKLVSGVKLKDGNDVKVNGVFIEVGADPILSMVIDLKLKKDKEGYLIVNEFKETDVKGLFAIGDVTTNKQRQAIVAASDGSVAALGCYNLLSK